MVVNITNQEFCISFAVNPTQVVGTKESEAAKSAKGII